jgi:hypothetical protein
MPASIRGHGFHHEGPKRKEDWKVFGQKESQVLLSLEEMWATL